MKTVGSDLQSHFGLDCTTLAVIFKAHRVDGAVFGFTTADTDLVFDMGDGDGSVTYLADTGITNTATETKDDLSVANSDVTGFLDSTVIVEDDIRAGLWNNAEIKVAVVNWADLTMGCMKLPKGTTGNIKLQNGLFTTEIRGIAQKLTAQIVYTYGPLCRAELGSGRDFHATGDIPSLTTLGFGDNHFSYIVRIKGAIVPNGTGIAVSLKAGSANCNIGAAAVLKTPAGSLTVVGRAVLKFNGSATFNISGGATVTSDIATMSFDKQHDYYLVAYTNDSGTPGIAFEATGVDMSGNDVADTTVVSGDQTAVSTIPTLSYNPGSNTTWKLIANAIIYDGTWNCFVDLGAYRQTGSVDSSADAVTIVPTSGLKKIGSATPTVDAPTDWFNDGVLTFTSGAMNNFNIEIKSWDGTTLKTFLPMPFAPVNGDTFIIEPGCDKTHEVCQSKFVNIANHRGEPFIPGTDVTMNYPDAK